jgi:glycosyltransferase involved in cell wall biosynthesis
MTRIMHVITTMGPAGAETMLCRMAAGMDASRFENEIVSLTGILDLAQKMQGIGIKVRTLGMDKSIPNPLLVMRLARWIRESKPDVIHTWMYHANLVGALAARVAGNVPVVWAIHHNSLDPNMDKRRTLLVSRACSFLSKRLPARIVCCSEASLQLHRSLGYAPEKLEVIPNGVDLRHLKPDPSARDSVHQELGIPAQSPIIGIAARFHPHKDHRNFIRAAARLHQQRADAHFVLCGMGITWQNVELSGWIEAMGLRNRCHLLGAREDVPRLFSAMDIASTSSRSEAFPVAICEAMACGTPSVVTDVGDSAMIVGETGVAVPARDPAALAEGWRKLLDAGPDERQRLGMAARERVERHFALPSIVERYQAIYADLAAGTPNVAPGSSISEYV